MKKQKMHENTIYDYSKPLKKGDFMYLQEIDVIIEIDEQFIDLTIPDELFMASGERYATTDEIIDYKVNGMYKTKTDKSW